MARVDKHRNRTGNMVMIVLLAAIAILSITASAQLDIVTPPNNSVTANSSQTFEYYLNLDNATNCTISVNGIESMNAANLSNHDFNIFNGTLTPGENSWNVSCSSENATETSETRTIYLDESAPTIVLFTPQNNSKTNASRTDISFVALDNHDMNISCLALLDDLEAAALAMQSGTPGTASITNISEGMHNWSIRCKDQANNTQTSETRQILVNTTSPIPSFTMILSRPEFVIGEQGRAVFSAPSGTSIRMEVCPDRAGFVQCDISNTGAVASFPYERALALMNFEGKYILDAFFSFNNYNETKTIRYNVTNNIQVSIDGPHNVRKNTQFKLEATASGGAGTLNYTWNLSNGTRYNGREITLNYTTPGNYSATVNVRDPYNNSRNATIAFTVENAYAIHVLVRDAQTGGPIKDASVELDGVSKETDTAGRAVIMSKPGEQELTVFAENYTIYSEDHNITRDETVTINLDQWTPTNNKPHVTLIAPINNSGIAGTETGLFFKVNHTEKTNCSFYISERNDGFYIFLGTVEVAANSNAQQEYGVAQLENKSYWWKVECVDRKGRSGMSATWQMNVGQLTSPGSQDQEITYLNIKVKDLEQAKSQMENLPPEIKDAARTFGIISKLEESIRTIKNSIRDIDGLQYKTLTAQQKADEKTRLRLQGEAAYNAAPIIVELVDADTFVDYIKDEELEELMKEYLAQAESAEIKEKAYLNKLKDLQQEIVVSTKTKRIKVTAKDGTAKEYTGLIRSIKTYNLTKDSFLVEVIPKTFAADASEILSSKDFKVIKKDPIIRFSISGDTELSYYVESGVDLDTLKDAKTAVFIEPGDVAEDKVTGFSVSDIGLPEEMQLIIWPAMLVVIGGLLFVGIKYEGHKAAQYMFYVAGRDKKLHYVNVILNDINDNLQMGNLEKVHQLYAEAKTAYEELPDIAKNDVYEQIASTAAMIEEHQTRMMQNSKIEHIQQLVLQAHTSLETQELMQTLQLYKQIESEYLGLDDANKSLIHASIADLGNKINIIARQ